MPTNADGTMPFRQNNDFFWLSGVDQEESILVISPQHPDKNMREVLFLKETNQHIAIWEGAKLSKEEAFKTSGIKTVFWTSQFESKFKESQKKIKNITAEGTSGGGSVKVVLNGEGEIIQLVVADEVYKEEKTILVDLIVAAHNNAKTNLKSKTNDEISKATGEFGIPGFKWPL